MFPLQKLNSFVGFITAVVEIWRIHMKRLVAAPALLVRSNISFIIAQIEVLRKSLGGYLATEV